MEAGHLNLDRLPDKTARMEVESGHEHVRELADWNAEAKQ